MIRRSQFAIITGIVASTCMLGCTPLSIFNPSFVNQATGSVFPLAPGDRSGFIMVRVNNSTSVPIEFLITVERVSEPLLESETAVVTKESVRLLTPSDSRANDLGVLLDCPLTRIGLGEDLDRPTTESGIFIGAEQVGVGGFGVPANVNPLSAAAGNFDCGDTIVFQVLEASGTVGGVRVNAFVLDDESLSDEVTGIDTFVNARSLMEEQTVDPEEDE